MDDQAMQILNDVAFAAVNIEGYGHIHNLVPIVAHSYSIPYKNTKGGYYYDALTAELFKEDSVNHRFIFSTEWSIDSDESRLQDVMRIKYLLHKGGARKDFATIEYDKKRKLEGVVFNYDIVMVVE